MDLRRHRRPCTWTPPARRILVEKPRAGSTTGQTRRGRRRRRRQVPRSHDGRRRRLVPRFLSRRAPCSRCSSPVRPQAVSSQPPTIAGSVAPCDADRSGQGRARGGEDPTAVRGGGKPPGGIARRVAAPRDRTTSRRVAFGNATGGSVRGRSPPRAAGVAFGNALPPLVAQSNFCVLL